MAGEQREKVLEVRHLKKYFTDRNKNTVKAVDDVSFDIYRGETFGLVGESGCGKTTTGRVIIRLYDPTEGEIIFHGKRISGKISREEEKDVTNRMQMIFQDPVSAINPRMTVKEIICEGMKIKKMCSEEEMLERCYSMLRKVGLTEEHANRYPHEFSGGQRQRICIARSLVTEPDFIIADEPISALDVSVQAQVLNLLNQLRKELGLTVLFIAHNLSVVKYFSDRIGVMYYGKLVELADSAQLYKNPVHPYTRALLSAVPQPNPLSEKHRKRLYYDPSMHRYEEEGPEPIEVEPGHMVLLSRKEYGEYLAKGAISCS